jgi:uncharacterized protein
MSRIAVIGTGISGMGSAYLLHKKHDITLYEKSADIGGHSRTRMVQHGGKSIAVDTGFIVFNHQNYPNLCGMFRHLSVPTEKSDMTFAITINNGAIEWGGRNPNALFGQRSNLLRPQFWGFVRDIFRFNARALATAEQHPELTLGELLKKIEVGDWYARYFILPIGGAIWSCSLQQMLSFPAIAFVRFFKEHGLLSVIGQPQWHTVTGGSREYIKRLTFPYKDRILTNCAAVAIKRTGATILISDSTGQTREFDHVILACHGDQALKLLTDATEQEQSVLSTFRYSVNRAVLHKDTSIMPRRRRCWASWVYHSEDESQSCAIPITYWMNLLQNIDPAYPLFVTLNPHRPITAEHIFDEHVFEHPIYSPESVAAQKRLPEIQGRQNTWFCGAHWRNGFHEDGLASAVAVADAFHVEIPWR